MNDSAQGGSAAPGPKKNPWVKWVALGCGLAVLLTAAFAGLMFFVVKKATSGPDRGAHEQHEAERQIVEEVIQRFLSDAGAGNFEAAHDAFSVPLKEAQTLADFAAAGAANPTLFRVKQTAFTRRVVDLAQDGWGKPGAEFSGTLTLESGTEMPATFKLVREKDRWKFIGYFIGSG